MDGEMDFLVEPKIRDERRRHYVLRINKEDVASYTEPDREDIENEVWDFVKIAFWNMTQEDIDQCYDGWFPDSYQEAKAKYDVWRKQKEDEATMEEVTALAEKIGIHRLYAIVKEIRGE